jgi:RNA polymerase sigma-70 factor, ECF subfamily
MRHLVSVPAPGSAPPATGSASSGSVGSTGSAGLTGPAASLTGSVGPNGSGPSGAVGAGSVGSLTSAGAGSESAGLESGVAAVAPSDRGPSGPGSVDSSAGVPVQRGSGPASQEDEELVHALRRGEPGAAEALYRRLYPAVSRTLWRILQATTPDHDDLIQVTFERVIRTLLDGRFAGACSLTTWASSIASHAALDSLRSRARERRLFVDQESVSGWEGSWVSDGERSIHARSEVKELQGILARMNPQHVRAVILYDVLGHSLAEMAQVLGISEAAAQSRLSRGRKELLRRGGSKLGRKS